MGTNNPLLSSRAAKDWPTSGATIMADNEMQGCKRDGCTNWKKMVKHQQ